MYRGVTHLTLDEKGRLSVPAKYRERILASCEGQLIVTVDTVHCLMIYPLPDWEVIEQTLMNKPNLDKQVRRLQRLLVGHASEVDMSRQGRISIPPALREFAGLEKQVTLVGQGKKLELWDTAHWNQERDFWLRDEGESEGFSQTLDNLSL